MKFKITRSNFFKTLLKFGIAATTPMEPIIAKGAETILFATHAIIYPPEAATLSTQAVSLIPASLIL